MYNNTTQLKPYISFDALSAVDIRLGLVTEAEEIPKQKGYLKLSVSFGEEFGTRTVVTNLGKQMSAESFVGRSFPFVMNLEPRIIATHKSEAMIMASADSEGKVTLLVADGSGYPGDIIN